MDKIKDFIVAFNQAKKASQDEKNYDLNHQECTLETLFPSIKSTQKNKVEWNTEFKAIIQEINRMLVNMKQQSILENQNITAIINCDSFDDTQINNCANATNEFKKYYHLSEDSDNGFARYDRGRFIPKLEAAISHISCLAMSCILSIGQDTEAVFSEIMEIKDTIDNSSLVGEETNESYTKKYKRFVLIHDILPLLCDDLHDYLKKNSNFTQLFQKYGNCIRKCGKIVFDDKIHEDENEKKVDVFSIPRRIVQFIQILRHPFSDKTSRPVRIVIDSIKSVFEAEYLRQRYSSFYLFAISSEDKVRRDRLMNNEKKLSLSEIRIIDWNELSSEGYKIYQKDKEKMNNDERAFYNSVTQSDNELLHDYVREYSYTNNLQQFYLQDVGASIENADIFISNSHCNTISKNMELRWSVVRNVCLIMFPGLLTPTPIERCMQIAFAAKCNSGCLSRQVGAVVTDKDYIILSVGWNDVPCGDISCAYKNLVDLYKWEDKSAYSDYELEDIDFRNRIKNFQNRAAISKILIGLPMRYCFKDIHIKDKNPMRSRAMHAEEKALANCGDSCEGGYLFTTSSPCEMCSKNAKNHKIKKIYYVELYPGISEKQYTNAGNTNNRAKHILFTGAVGRAYTKMYTPLMPQKDILNMLGVYNNCWPDLIS